MTPSLSVLLAAAMASSLAAASPATSPDPALAHGRHVAERDCALCHAVDIGARSPNPSAPTFSAIRLRFNPIALEKALAPMPSRGHAAMPPRTLNPDEIPDLVAYIQAVGPKR